VINGYKAFFLNPSKPYAEDDYLEGTSFNDLYTLYLFDREIRMIFFRYILSVESALRSLISYRASEHYSDDQEFYLKKSSYSKSSEDNHAVERLIGKLQKTHDARIDRITHYRKDLGTVPFWVLIGTTTFGTLSFFYKLLSSRGVKQLIVNDIRTLYEQERQKPLKLTIEKLTRDLWVLVDFRNVCAHGERFYCHQCRRINIFPSQTANVTYLLNVLYQYLSYEEEQTLQKEMVNFLNDFPITKGLSRRTLKNVMDSMGFDF
jgi:abortive infection bacteriophage resistance protein